MTSHEETQYLTLLRNIIETGTLELTRNGNCQTVFGRHMSFSLKGGVLPILTTRKISIRVAFFELMFFIRGQTNIEHLPVNDIHIWDANSTREFLDSRNLTNYPVGELGPIYGAQWRHFNSTINNIPSVTEIDDGIDQLAEVIKLLKDPELRTSRRIVMTAWNPAQLVRMALPPCHILCQFHVKNGKHLSCALYQRSMDAVLGCPTNILSYSLLTHILAKHCDLVADQFVHFIGNAHIYEEHIEGLRQQIDRTPFEFPRIQIINKRENIEDYEFSDIIFETPYVSHGPIKFRMYA
jgi:thymidylate synthase